MHGGITARVMRKEAEEYIKTYLDHFSGVRNYMTNVVEHAKETGYVETSTVCWYALSIFIIPVSIQFVKRQTGFFAYLRLDSFRQNML